MASVQDKSIVKQLDDITECSICSERFTDPRSLPCVHSFCLICIERFARDEQPGSKMPCPMCRKEFIIPDGGVRDLPKNFFISKLLHIKQSASGSNPSVCDSCQPDEARGVVKKNAAVYCVECSEKYCEDCARWHSTFKMSRFHKQMKLDDLGEFCHQEEVLCKSSPTLCEKHQDQALSIYCRDCKSAICVICFIAGHKLHDCSDINDVIEKFRDMMTTDVSSLADVAGKLREMLSSVERQKQDFANTVGEAEQEICDKAEEMKQLIERNKRTLLDELATKQRHVVKMFDNLCEELAQHLTLVDNLKKYTEELSRKGAGADIARETSVLHDRVEELVKLDVLQQSRDGMDSTDIKFTASVLLTKDCDNAIGKIDVMIVTKVKKEKPAIVMSREKVKANSTENVRFELRITGEPEPCIEWFKEGVKLTSSNRTVMEKNGNVVTLMMRKVVLKDGGQYTVRATNSEGSTNAMVTLSVKEQDPTLRMLTKQVRHSARSYIYDSDDPL